ncbi:GntR family transcriptional regulator [Paenibacillus filicis]|uniref:GntR family transcriptional regulator n=1 Tax=Paenibacillus gyeongsangnamensis TaxID=3388067 RepID=A0ABT4QC91_9BACL|nr:GntR family transcriptional regulator [Paenibacillus filicis]MCZ8514502.1 GntR family transcriptional regulator [Paenibacillus filicis]
MQAKQAFVRNRLEQMIGTRFQVGDKLPSEPDMARELEVSRETFRAAVKLLEQEGKLRVKHGVGTFVVRPLPTIPSPLEKLFSIGSMIRSARLEEGESRMALREEGCPPETAKALGLAPGDPVIVLERIRTANGEPVAFSVNTLPKSLVGNLFSEADFSGSLLSYFKNKLGHKLVTVDSEIAVPLPTDRYVQQLVMNPNSTVLLMKQLHYDEGNRPLLYSLDYLRNDVFTFHIRRTL